jgi:hypothetical protein
MCWVLAQSRLSIPPIFVILPRLRAKYVVYVLDTLISPDAVMYAFPTQGLQRVINVRKWDLAALEYVGKKRLVGELVL